MTRAPRAPRPAAPAAEHAPSPAVPALWRPRLIALGLALVPAAFLLGRRTGAPAAPAAAAGAAASAPARAPAPAPAAAPRAAAPKLALGGPTEDRLRQNLDEYRKTAVYPPWSRPFVDGTRYLLQWNKPATADLPMDDRDGRQTTYRFDADRAHVAYGEAITSWIEVWRRGDPTDRVPLAVEEAWVVAVGGPRTGRLVRLVYHDDGRDGDEVAGDLRYTNRFVPSDAPELRQALQVRLTATVSCCDGVRRSFVRELTYAPRRVAEVVGLSDAIRDGSLAVTVDLDVHEAGTYDLEANLVGADGARPIGYTQRNARLGTGRQRVDLIFFGRMFQELAVDGPYVVRDLRGALLMPDGGEHNIWFRSDAPFQTRPWRHDDFSAAEWNDAEKQERIAIMERLLAETSAGRLGGPTATPEHIEIDANGIAHVVHDPPPPAE